MNWIKKIFAPNAPKHEWLYGFCRNKIARKHIKKGNVQFVLWLSGEQGYTEDCWINFDRYWWPEFKEAGEFE